MKRDTLFEKLEIILVIETLILLMAMINAPTASAKQQPANAVHIPVHRGTPFFELC